MRIIELVIYITQWFIEVFKSALVCPDSELFGTQIDLVWKPFMISIDLSSKVVAYLKTMSWGFLL